MENPSQLCNEVCGNGLEGLFVRDLCRPFSLVINNIKHEIKTNFEVTV